MVPQPVKVSNSCFSEPDTKTNADNKWHILSEFPSEYAKTVHG